MKMNPKPKPKPLTIEDYDSLVKNPLLSSSLSFSQLNQIVQIHGFLKLNREFRRKEFTIEALTSIDELLNPNRSTLDETQISPNNVCISADVINADLDALGWKEFPVQSIQSLSYNNDDEDYDNRENERVYLERIRRKRGRKPKERMVFDAVHLTKPRSKIKTHKRTNLSDFIMSNPTI